MQVILVGGRKGELQAPQSVKVEPLKVKEEKDE